MQPIHPHLARLVDVALANVAAEYPYHIVHLAHGDGDIAPPRTLYPAFHGSYDWHSCVHMHWSLVRALGLASSVPGAQSLDPERRARIVAHLDARLTPARVAGEVAYFEARGHAAFERPYGWGWLLLLAAEVESLAAREGRSEVGARAARWAEALAPLAALLRARFFAWLPRAEYPTRAGTHGNGAFALVLASTFAAARRDTELAAALREAARRWYGADTRYPAEYEPGGDDFLSGGLCEALAMARLGAPGEFAPWWRDFEPDTRGLARWAAPAGVSDPTDPKIVHLAGLNLSRAWCWRELAPHLPADRRPAALAAAEVHAAVSLPAATTGDYVGTHWLASFALLALTGDRPRE